MKGMTAFLGAMVLAFTLSSLFVPQVLAATPTWAVGGFTAKNFTTSTVVGMKTNDLPYWENPVAWGGPDKGIAFVLTVLSPYGEGKGQNPGWQIGLLARQGTKYMDTFFQNPGDSGLTDVCNECLDGTTTHTYQISRISNGWTSYMDGSSVQITTGSVFSNDYVDMNYNQMPVSMEVAVSITQANIDNNFQVSEGVSFYYEVSPVGSGTWNGIPHMYAYYTNGYTCTNFQVGSNTPPTWAVAYTAAPYGVKNVEMGTTTYLPITYNCGSQFY